MITYFHYIIYWIPPTASTGCKGSMEAEKGRSFVKKKRNSGTSRE